MSLEEILANNKNTIVGVERIKAIMLIVKVGDGSVNNPGRFEKQIWSDDGELLSRQIITNFK